MAAKLSSISKAAERLEIGQPAVTTHIRKLEDELQLVLFDRVKRPIQLTPSGATLSKLATPLVEAIDDLVVKTSVAEKELPVVVASIHDIIPHTLLRVVRVYLQRYPHAHLNIRAGLIGEVLAMISEGEADLGLTPYPGRSERLDFHSLFAYERVLIAPRNHPLLQEELTSLDQIARWPLILMRRETYTRTMLEQALQRKGTPYEIVVELDSMDIIKRYVALGMGVSVGPRLAIESADERELGVISLANLLPIEQVGIVTLRGKTLSTPALRLISTIRDTLSSAGASLLREVAPEI